MGKLAIDAILQRDVLYSGATFVAINLLVDLSYTLLDPRIRLGGPGGETTTS